MALSVSTPSRKESRTLRRAGTARPTSTGTRQRSWRTAIPANLAWNGKPRRSRRPRRVGTAILVRDGNIRVSRRPRWAGTVLSRLYLETLTIPPNPTSATQALLLRLEMDPRYLTILTQPSTPNFPSGRSITS